MSKLYLVYREAVKILTAAGCEDPFFDARELADFSMGFNKTQLLLKGGEELDPELEKKYMICVQRRASREPLQYILGSWGFERYRFLVGEGVLIPRPETELLPAFAVEQLRKRPCAVIYDLCCGTGCVGITVAKLFPTVRVFCIDLSDDALAYANKNKEKLDAPNVTVLKADVLEGGPLAGVPLPEMILSNPPYVPTAEIADLQPEVRREPKMALDGGEDGLTFYRALAEKWFPLLPTDGTLAMECGEGQAEPILRLFISASGGRLLKDGSGTDRVVVVRR